MVYAKYKSMEDLTNATEGTVLTIKERLLIRFARAKKAALNQFRAAFKIV